VDERYGQGRGGADEEPDDQSDKAHDDPLVALLALSVAWPDEVSMRGTSGISVMSGSARLRYN